MENKSSWFSRWTLFWDIQTTKTWMRVTKLKASIKRKFTCYLTLTFLCSLEAILSCSFVWPCRVCIASRTSWTFFSCSCALTMCSVMWALQHDQSTMQLGLNSAIWTHVKIRLGEQGNQFKLVFIKLFISSIDHEGEAAPQQDLSNYRQDTCPEIIIHMGVLFAPSRHANCRTNYLGEETRRLWWKPLL